MQIFYTPDISGLEYTLSEDESKHAIKVLRMVEGEALFLVDGKGTMYESIIADTHPKRCKVIVTKVINNFEKRPYYLHIAISPLKNPDRFEWFLEKATEIGIDEVTPLLCDRSEKKLINIDRCNRIVESAMKQSLKAFHPQVNPLTKFSDVLKQRTDEVKMIACCEGERKRMKDCYLPGQRVSILIGPEGDFTPDEIGKAQSANFQTISLGESRLRTETAAIAACHSISFMNL